MGRRFILFDENMTLGTGSVLAAFQTTASPNAGSFVEIERIEVSQSGTSTSAQVRLVTGTRDTAGTLTMTATTPKPLVLGGPASAFTGNTAPAGGTGRSGTNSSADSGGTYTNTYPANPNNLGGWLWTPTEKEGKIIVPPSTLFVVRFLAAPATTTGWTVAVWMHEVI